MAVIPPEDEDADATNLDEEAKWMEGDSEAISKAENAEEEDDDYNEVEDDDDDDENDDEDVPPRRDPPPAADASTTHDPDYRNEDRASSSRVVESDSPPNVDDDVMPIIDIISSSTPSTPLEFALINELDRRTRHNELLINEVTRLREFLSKRKQTYRRKRTDVDAPRKKLSGYNVFVRERFAALARENEEALRMGVATTTTSSASGGGGGEVVGGGVELKRIPPASSISSTGKAWSMLSAEEKERYNAM
jgi:hypothetical protein